jgi:lipopolysaccharide transport system permease protein
MDDVKIYSAESSLRQPGVLLKGMFRDLFMSRELGWRLAVRDISAMYRQSLLGFLWAVIVPLTNALVWILLRGAGVVSVNDTGIPYPVYVFSGTMLWAVFTESMQAPLQKVIAGKSILGKINFPREALVISGILQSFFNAMIKVVLILGVMFFLGYPPSWTAIFFPLGVFSLILTGTALGLLLTPIGTLYTDISKGLPIIMQFLMYVTPVVYAVPHSGFVATIISYNPLTPLVVTTRDWLTGQPAEYMNGFIMLNLAFIVVLLLAWLLYRTSIPFLIERMSA